MYIDDRGRRIYTGQEAFVAARRFLESRKLQGKTTFQNLPISIENRRGSVRKGTDDDGDEWRTKMKVPYGYIKGTRGVDGDALDVFIGPDEDAAYAYVIHCNTPDGKQFDEDKVMLGFSSSKAARNCFHQHYDSPKFFGGIDEIPMWKFRDKAFIRKHTTKKLVASRAGAHQPNSTPGYRAYDKGMTPIAINLVHSFYSDVLGSKMSYEDIEKNIEINDPDTRTTTQKKKVAEAASLQVPNELFEEKLDTLGRGTDQDMRRSILGHHQDIMEDPEVREGGPGSGPREHHSGEDRCFSCGRKLGKYSHRVDTRDGQTVFVGSECHKLITQAGEKGYKPPGIGPRLYLMKSEESEEHGVQGQKWGVRHARQDGAGQQGKPAPKRDLANDPRTLSMMQVIHRSQSQLNAISWSQKEKTAARLAAQQKPASPQQNHGEALNALKQLGWRALGAAAQITGLGGQFQAIQSLMRSPSGQKLFLNTNRNGHLLTTDRKGKIPASKSHQPKPYAGTTVDERNRDSINKALGRAGSRLRVSRGSESFREAAKKTYYARPLNRYGRVSEQRDVESIREAFPEQGVKFPRTRRHAELGMGYFHKKIDAAKRVVLRPDRKNRLTAGVFSEATHALKKKIPVFAFRKGKLRRVASVEALRKPNREGHFGKIIFRKRKKH